MTSVQRINVYRLSIPLRRAVSHATSNRRMSEPIVVALKLTDGTIGYGETLPRRYVTGEDVNSVMEAIRDVLAPKLKEIRFESFPVALEAIEALPWRAAGGRPIPAARAAVELALLDAVLRSCGCGMNEVVQWMGLSGFGSPGSMEHIRFSGVLAAGNIEKTMRQLRLMYWGGLRAFKLKVGFSGDLDRLAKVATYLQKPLAKGRATLRVDANGAWSLDEAKEWLAGAARFAIAAVEQPLAKEMNGDLPALREFTNMPIMYDESLVTVEDARRLIDLGVADAFNIRISKCGGLLPSLRLAALARRHGVRIQLGCMVGETSLLSAAGVRFLEVCPGVEWAEGCFGSFLLQGDITNRGLRFGFGGRTPKVGAEGLGVEIDLRLLSRYSEEGSIVIEF